MAALTVERAFQSLEFVKKNISNISTTNRLEMASNVNRQIFDELVGTNPEQVPATEVTFTVTGDPFTYTLPADVESTTFKDGGLFVKRDGALIQERLTPQGQEVNRVQGYKYRGSTLTIQGLGNNQEVIFRYIPELARFTATTDTFVVTDRYLELVRAGLLHQYAIFDQDPAAEVEADQRFRLLMTDFIDTKRVTSDVLTFF